MRIFKDKKQRPTCLNPYLNPLSLGCVSLVLVIATFVAKPAWGGEIPEAKKEADVRFIGIITDKKYGENISGIAVRDNLLVIGADEGAKVQVLKRQNAISYKGEPDSAIPLQPEADEVDIEGVALGKEYFYVIGSHSRTRKTVDDSEREVKGNLKRLQQTEIESNREQLFRLKLDANGNLVPNSIRSVSLSNTILNNQVLAPFQVIPSKENGIDIEGIAADEDRKLYIGFRGPVLRGNFVPILILEIDFEMGKIDDEMIYVNLDGWGIRDIVKVDGGVEDDKFLIVAGPIGDEPTSKYRLYRWNGKNTVPGKDNPNARNNVKALCVIPPPANNADTKAEGITLIAKDGYTYHFIIVYDGADNGGATMFSCEVARTSQSQPESGRPPRP